MLTSPNVFALAKDALDNGIYNAVGSGAPTNAVTGAGLCGPGSLYVDYTNAILYMNTGTQASPTWTTIGSGIATVLTSPQITTSLGTPQAIERTFTETTGAGVYTGSVTVPAGAEIVDIIVSAVALWNTTTSATLKVGDAVDDDGYYTGVDLKATDLLAGESISFAFAGGKEGAYIANAQVSPRYLGTARTIKGIITSVGAAGTLGRTRMTVIYHLPVTADIVAATKV